MTTTANNTALIESVRPVYDLSGIKRISNSKLGNDIKLFEKLVTQEQKSNIATSQPEADAPSKTVNFQYLPNTPVIRSEKKEKVFNEPRRPSRNVQKAKSKEGKNEDESSSEVFEIESGSDFYIVDNMKTENSTIKQIQDAAYRLRQNIKKKYAPEFFRSPGTLVNLVY